MNASDLRLPPAFPGMRVGLFGGTFDPPHAGHVEVSRVALRALALDQVWWLVSPHNPLKRNAPSADLARRIKAARLITNDPRIKVTGVEAALGTTYTAETLARPAAEAPRCRLRVDDGRRQPRLLRPLARLAGHCRGHSDRRVQPAGLGPPRAFLPGRQDARPLPPRPGRCRQSARKPASRLGFSCPRPTFPCPRPRSAGARASRLESFTLLRIF
ncbi:MAG: hypothetical protein WDM84_06290 [Bauldia sp.]